SGSEPRSSGRLVATNPRLEPPRSRKAAVDRIDSRPSGFRLGLLRRRNRGTKNGRAAFADVVPSPCRNLDNYIAFDTCLGAQARVERQIGGGIEAVQFVVRRLREVLLAFFDHHMAGRAGAVSAAGMLEMQAKIEGNVEQRLRKPMILVRQLPGLELHGYVVG